MRVRLRTDQSGIIVVFKLPPDAIEDSAGVYTEILTALVIQKRYSYQT